MKYILAIILIMTASNASAQRIRDQSLSPEESMRQPDISNSGTQPLGGTWSNNFGINNEGAGHTQNFQSGSVPYGQTNTLYFMDNYCSQQNKPLVSSSHLAYMTGCMEDIKVKACDAFQRLPIEVMRKLDIIINCAFNAATMNTVTNGDSACDYRHELQLELLKTYWNNQDISYNIAFMPDMVANPVTFCSRR